MRAEESTTNLVRKNWTFKDNFIRYFGLAAIVILVLVFTFLDNSFVNEANLKSLLSDTAPLMIMAAGMTFVLLLGSVDLSVGSVCSVSNVIVVKILVEMGKTSGNMAWVTFVGYLVAILFGLGSGILLGVIHVRFKIPSFIASLGFMSIWKSVALLISDASVSVSKVMWPSVDWAKVTFGLIGLPLVLAIALILIFHIIQTRTSLGKSIMATGGNERAARIAGIKVARTKILAFAIMGMCAALGGVFLAAKLRSSAPTVGDPFTLLVIASVVLGGTTLTGGKGYVLGTVIGVFITAIIRNGMNIVGVDVFWQNIVFGLVVLGAVALTVDRKSRNIIVK
jgi:Ribose/xylose/arabinose/galactoside ABC-type transport systems, permease components